MTGKTGLLRVVAGIAQGMAVVDKSGLSTGGGAGDAVSPEAGRFAQVVVHRGCLILAVSSWTRL